MKTVYLIIAWEGEYEDYSEWPIVSCLSKEQAQALCTQFAEASKALQQEYCEARQYPDYPSPNTDEEWEKYIAAVEAVDAKTEKIYAKHPAAAYAPDHVSFEAKYVVKEIRQIET